MHRDGAEIASGSGGVPNSDNGAMELTAILEALFWLDRHAPTEPATLWSDSVYAVKGCNRGRHIWKNSGWKKRSPNGKGRSRTIASADIWKAIDAQLARNALVTIAWCKGHSGISGNERADELAGVQNHPLAGASQRNSGKD